MECASRTDGGIIKSTHNDEESPYEILEYDIHMTLPGATRLNEWLSKELTREDVPEILLGILVMLLIANESK